MKFSLSEYQKICRGNIDKFREKVLPFDPIEHGVFPSESFAWCMLGEYFHIDMVIESGMGWGASAEMFARYFSEIPVYTIEAYQIYSTESYEQTAKRLSAYPNITCIHGDGHIEVMRLVQNNPQASIGLFVDGPKGEQAIKLCNRSFTNSNVKFAGIHDQCLGERYHLMDKMNGTVFYTDVDWIQIYESLNSNAYESQPRGGMGFAVNEIYL